MAFSYDLAGIDLNEPTTLGLYSQVLLFKNDLSKDDVQFVHRPGYEQRILQSVAHSMTLEYEYSVATRTVRISRPVPIASSGIDSPTNPGLNDTGVPNLDAFNHFHGQEDFLFLLDETEEIDKGFGPSFDKLDTPNVDDILKDPSPLPSGLDPNIYTISNPKDAQVSGVNYGNFIDEFDAIYSADSISNKAKAEERILTKRKDPYVPTSYRPYTCSNCSQNFPTKSSLRRHQWRIHNGPYLGPFLKRSNNQESVNSSGEGSAGFHVHGSSIVAIPAPGVSFVSHSYNSIWPPGLDTLFPSDTKSSRRVSDQQSPSSAYPPSRRGSDHSAASAGYQEIIFDSNSVHSGSQVSGGSGASGRRGRLSDWARAGMNAVKKVGACWRCKFLRKTCNPESPCSLCPRGENSNWGAVGCKRGDFRTTVQTVDICQIRKLLDKRDIVADEKFESNLAILNSDYDKGCVDRDLWRVGRFISTWRPGSEDTTDFNISTTATRELFLRSINSLCYSLIRQPTMATLNPLKDCILDIAWELLKSPSSLSVLDSKGSFEHLARFLASGAVYQAKLDSDQLIAQSLICLRSCLEAIRVQESGFLDQSHHHCTSIYRVTCIEGLNLSLGLYLDELSRVFFKKDNLRRRYPWWLSTFYSFCIQAMVRRALIHLTKTSLGYTRSGTNERAKQYLHLPLRLFIASSSSYDPLTSDINGLPTVEIPGSEDYRMAKKAVGRADWILNGITSTGDYLKELFEDDGSALKRASSPTTFRMLETLDPQGASTASTVDSSQIGSDNDNYYHYRIPVPLPKQLFLGPPTNPMNPMYQRQPRRPDGDSKCRYCRRRRIRCISSTTDEEGRCTNCVRFQQECIPIVIQGRLRPNEAEISNKDNLMLPNPGRASRRPST